MRRLVCVVAVLAAACSPAGGGVATSTSTVAGTSVPPTTAPGVATTSTTVLRGVDAGAGVGDRMFPDLGNAGYDVSSYHVDLTFDTDLAHVSGEVTIEVVASQSLQSFTMDFVGYDVSRVLVDGDPARYAREGRDMRITPDEVIPAATEFSVFVAYEGTIGPVDLTDFSFPTGWQRGDTGSVFLFSQPDGASGVFPSNDHPRDRANVTLEVTVPAGHVVVSGGVAGPVEESGDRRVFTFDIPQVAPYLIPLAIGGFEAVTAADGVVTWLDGDSDLPPGFERQGEILAALEADLGPYPFERSDAVVVASGFPAALETQTLPTYTTASAAWGTPVIAHELAHQWFGNDIVLAQWDDIWLNEGPATFMTWRWIEIDRGREAYEAEVRRAWDGMFAAALPPPDHPPGQDLFNASVYQRGGLALVALRDLVGDDAFFDFLRAYVTTFSGEAVTTESFLTLVLVMLGPEAESLVVDWIRGEEMPPLG